MNEVTFGCEFACNEVHICQSNYQQQRQMTTPKKEKPSEIDTLFAQMQAASFDNLADTQIRASERNIMNHEQLDESIESYVGGEPYEQFDPVLNKISHLKALEASKGWVDIIQWNSSYSRNREKLFRRQRISQKQEIACVLNEINSLQINEEQKIQNKIQGNEAEQIQQKYRQRFRKLKAEVRINSHNNRAQNLQFREQDVQKLFPGEDLNDTIIDNYLKIIKNAFLPAEITSKVHFYSTFFFHKLLGQNIISFMESQLPFQSNRTQIGKVKQKIGENYIKVKRWTKNTDVFEKELLVFPINAFNHWFCIMVLNPINISSSSPQNPCEIIYCDSMFQKKEFMIESVKEYLRIQLQEKKGIRVKQFQQNAIAYQLLLPRQTNTHDCGLYMLAYIDQLLTNRFEQLKEMKCIEKRHQLNLFPRKLILTMRERLLMLIQELSKASADDVEQLLQQFFRKKQELVTQSPTFDQINEKQLEKYKSMISYNCKLLNLSEAQFEFSHLIKFYIDPEINHYQKDKLPEPK